jgi:hypothetical protein
VSLYISSNNNRLYVGGELAYGQAAPTAALNRLPLIGLAARQTADVPTRHDKTGSRSYPGIPSGVRRVTTFTLQTPLSTWDAGSVQPACGPLFQAAMGAAPQHFEGGVVTSNSGTVLGLQAPHGLAAGHAIAHGGEIRFVSAIGDAHTIHLNAPFTNGLGVGSLIDRSITYRLGDDLASCSLIEYWQDGAINRLLTGVAVDELLVTVNADWHQFQGYFRQSYFCGR